MSDETKQNEWNSSYSKGDNFIYYPHEEVIRFFARYVRKRVGINDFENKSDFDNLKVLDLGCGIGRHVRFCDDIQIEAYGIDLSEVAIKEAKRLCEAEGRKHLVERFHIGSVTKTPWKDGTFNFIVSNGVLDSMSFELAKATIAECRRILSDNGKFYLDLISGDDDNHYTEFSGDEIVTISHEKNTIQSYYNFARIQELIGGSFSLEECRLIRNQNVIGPDWHSRYHTILKGI